MRFSAIVLLAVTAIIFSPTAAGAEEPERIADYNVPETSVVPLSFSVVSPDALVVEGEKSSFAQIENSVIHLDDNNRLVGLSN